MQLEKATEGGTTAIIVHIGPEEDPAEARAQAEDLLPVHGAVLLRGLGISDPDSFHEAVRGFGSPTIDSYRGGNTPRSTVSEGVFTSTEYPARYEITLHNELSYAHQWPSRLFFCCLVAAETGGATPVCDGRALLADLDPAVRERFESRQVAYHQHLHGGHGLGKSWQQTFETRSRARAEEYLTAAGARFAWTTEGGLRVTQVRAAVRQHPATGEPVWFNQATQWHPSNLPYDEADLLLSVVDSELDLPHSASYGDGGAIGADDLAQVRRAERRNKLSVPWRPGDLMMIDNMLVLHGREPFTGSRKVIVSMT
ncbi:TauD/TfdA family dioxygenase [Kutzneria albida]|uniref:TauD/TfdA-like domain-containing protein n=1 Tax=Kutzneria albida DSM 43870 TaxID=1449976 RepID=W5WEK2_9PSEU|nr:TauD/TfdA family dioxygenase [Kutzneria albida]AHH99272.1 hypothetical protein KALB_5911 [Kutzneria albida DSM 43870]